MQRAHLTRRAPIAILVAIALFAEPRVGTASSITSCILIDPAGEHTGDEFGRSVAWVGDVNGDGYDGPSRRSVGVRHGNVGSPS